MWYAIVEKCLGLAVVTVRTPALVVPNQDNDKEFHLAPSSKHPSPAALEAATELARHPSGLGLLSRSLSRSLSQPLPGLVRRRQGRRRLDHRLPTTTGTRLARHRDRQRKARNNRLVAVPHRQR